jgi:hypothetical protein
VVLDRVVAELDSLMSWIGGRFARAEPRVRVREYVSVLVAGLERKNGWTLAERAGERIRRQPQEDETPEGRPVRITLYGCSVLMP